jgi:hypothetical protein
LKCTKGPDRGNVFHVVGERLGVLWVAHDGEPRAVPLLHCHSEAAIAVRFGFKDVGSTSLTALNEIETEPTRAALGIPKPLKVEVRSAGISAVENSTKAHSPDSSEKRCAVASSAAAVEATSKQTLKEEHQRGERPKTISNELAGPSREPGSLLFSPPPAVEEDLRETSFGPQSNEFGPTRLFFKAVALWKLGYTGQRQNPLAFHEYFSKDTSKRLSEAWKALPAARRAWALRHPTQSFDDIGVDDILKLIAARPDILTV